MIIVNKNHFDQWASEHKEISKTSTHTIIGPKIKKQNTDTITKCKK